MLIRLWLASALSAALLLFGSVAHGEDFVRALQEKAATTGAADWGHWGPDASKYSSWTSHSNRLIPIYSFGMTMEAVKGANSVYRDASRLEQLYYRLPEDTLNPEATYFDQTDVYRLQRQAAESGKKYIILFVFDGMDWQTTQAAATYKAGKTYREGRGSGLLFLDYSGTVTDFGYFVTSPYANGVSVDVNSQSVHSDVDQFGGYNPLLGGAMPWEAPSEPEYLIGKSKTSPHAYTDSATSAMSMTTGLKSYNNAVNVDPFGRKVPTIAHQLAEQGMAIGVVTSVPISHATPACAYSHNVHRSDYQDLTRDLLGLPSISHPNVPLPGVDVLIGAGWGENRDADKSQGENYVPGNRYLADADLAAISLENGGRYVVAQRTPGRSGREGLDEAARKARENGHRLFGFYGVAGGHLPFATADGKYDPTFNGVRSGDRLAAESYTEADLHENPTLAEMTSAALHVLETREEGFWLMVEPGDVDWANHANNIDNSIGAVISGDEAFRAVVEWIEAKDAWEDAAVFVTADHGHLLMLEQPEVLAGQPADATALAPPVQP